MVEADDDYGQCGCGEAWFELQPPEDVDVEDPVPAVCIDMQGNITGYAGKLVCISCGEDWNPNVKFKRRGHLRVVQ